ncbi:MAG TPA: trypsin-like serine protease [Kofleriaceae bacterium]
MRLAVAALACLALVGARAAAAPVVGGQTASAGQWPDAVAVIGATGTCTGTLIAPDLVLTAGHCGDITPQQVVANSTNYNVNGERRNVTAVYTYPNWSGTYDAAVLRLAAPYTAFSPRGIGVACTFDGIADGTMVHLVGFGLTTTDATGTNTLLYEAVAPVTDPDCSGGDGCRASIAPGGELVAGGGGIDTCNGDSGGPLYLDTPRGTFVVGVVSRGVSASSEPCGDGGIYVRTDKLVSWIEQTTGEALAHDSCDGSTGSDDGSGSGSDRGGSSDDPPTAVGGCAASGGATSLAWLVFPVIVLRSLLRRARPLA